MKAVIMPGFSELIIVINPVQKVTRGSMISAVMPWLYAPWPEAKNTGIIEIEFKGDTLKDLLVELSKKYKEANLDFEIINSKTNDVDFDFTVLVNGKNYAYLPKKLDTKLLDGDGVNVKVLWRWDG